MHKSIKAVFTVLDMFSPAVSLCQLPGDLHDDFWELMCDCSWFGAAADAARVWDADGHLHRVRHRAQRA